jgi:hypothetical protein
MGGSLRDWSTARNPARVYRGEPQGYAIDMLVVLEFGE